MSDLDARLIAAHEAGDRAALVTLYSEASEAAQDEVASSFYLTHAFVFALESGDTRASELRKKLKDMGRL